MKSTPKISFVTPSYNQVGYLEYTLRSVLDQNYDDMEYVVIDAGSKDGSVDLIRKYADRLAYWHSEPDRGHADGVNKGFSQTHGEIMAWINSSDVYYPWTLQTVVQIFNDLPSVQWIMGMPSHLMEGSYPKNIRSTLWNHYDFISGNYSWIQQESVFWRRKLWDQAGGGLNIDIKYACDFELWLRFFKLAPLYHANNILAGFRSHENQRGSDANYCYYAEANECHTEFYKSFGWRERWRGFFIRLTNGNWGCIIRNIIKKCGFMNWYQHPRIIYDFQSNRWIIAYNREIIN